MRFSRLQLLVAALFGLPLLAVGALLLLLRFGAFDASIARALSRSLATPVAFDHLGLSLLPGPGVALEGLRVGDEQAGAPLIDGARVTVALPWHALRGDFSRQRAVAIDAGQLNLRIDAAGHDNWTALVDRVLELMGEGPAAFRVDALGMKDLRLRFEDARTRRRFAIAGFSMTATEVVPRKPFRVELRLGATSDPWSGHGRLAGRATLDPDRGRYAVDLDRFTIWLGGGGLPIAGVEATGRIEGLAWDMQADRVSVKRAQATAAGVAFEAQGTVAQATTAPAADFRLKTAPFAPRPFAQTLGIELPKTADPATLARAELALTVVASTGSIGIRDFDGTLDDTHASGAADLPLEEGVAPRIVLAADRIDLDRYLPPDAPKAPGSAATLEASLDALRKLDIDADIAIDEARAAGVRLRGLRLRVEPNRPVSP